MIEIKKGSEPKEWTAKCKTPDFTKYEAIPELRTALAALSNTGFAPFVCDASP
jgi:hypothetical protein